VATFVATVYDFQWQHCLPQLRYTFSGAALIATIASVLGATFIATELIKSLAASQIATKAYFSTITISNILINFHGHLIYDINIHVHFNKLLTNI